MQCWNKKKGMMEMKELNKYFTARKSVVNMPLVQEQNNQVVTTSLIVSEVFGKEHKHVMRDIRNLTVQNWAVKEMFVEGVYKNERNREYPMYYMNRDGFTLLAMGFTGKKALEFKLKFIEQFNLMEKHIKEQSQPRVLTREELIAASAELTLANNQKIKEMDKKLEQNSQDIDYLKQDMRIDRRQERILQRKGAKKVIDELGGKDTKAYKELSRKAFAELWGSFKNYFEVGSYSDLPRVRFDEACDYIDIWRPSTHLAVDIQHANRQMHINLRVIKGGE